MLETLTEARAPQVAEFLHRSGRHDAAVTLLAGDASFRKYFRIATPSHGIEVLMDAPPPQEDIRPFVRIARHLCGLGLSAPRILAEDEAAGLLLLEDLGDDTYTRLLAKGQPAEADLYALAVDVLIALHRAAVPAAGVPPYDLSKLLTEASLLIDWYVPATQGDDALTHADRAGWLAAWRDALAAVDGAVPDALVLRDFHVDNLMLLPDRDGIAACGLLDFQDAVIGPVTYDLMSLLEDARRDIDPALVAAMTDRYLAAFPALDRAGFAASMAVLGAQRHAKVIGIFTRLCRRDGKPQYLRHIPRVWRLFERSLSHPALAPVKAWVDTHIPPARRTVPQ